MRVGYLLAMALVAVGVLGVVLGLNWAELRHQWRGGKTVDFKDER